MRYGVPRLVHGVVRDLFREDVASHYRDLLGYAVPELQTLESAFAWIDRLGAEAIDACKPIDHLDQAVLAEAFQGKLISQDPSDQSARVLLERISAECAAAPPRAKRGATRSVKRRRRAK
jgi:hypothetical protein